jgi:hypothetical protein
MSGGRAKEISGKIRGDAERRRRLAREEDERRQKIAAYAPRIWEELRRLVPDLVEGVNAELKDEVAHFIVKPLNYRQLKVSREEPPLFSVYLTYDLNLLRIDVETRVPGKKLSEKVPFDFDPDDAGQVRLKSGDRVLETDEAAEVMLEAVWIPPDEAS